MELSFGFMLLAYYTWWILLLVALVIIIYKLVTQQNFQVSGQAQNSVKAIDCTKKNQNFNSKSGTKMASGQESDLVTANRDIFVGSVSHCHGDSDGHGEVPPVDVDQNLSPDDV